ncbi:MAG: hypothetical protein PPFGHCPK_00486 [Spiroplasma endosymbiont of Drosophila atripex]|nr:MAG: hypothetical protein PPFGHCPK_00486 [Spiroplasma endosymbiont of Drosophila atripex]
MDISKSSFASSMQDENNCVVEIVKPSLSRKKSFRKKFKKNFVKNLPIIAAGTAIVVTLAAGGTDGFQCSDLGIAANAGTSGAMMGAVIKATIKQNKQEKVEQEDENNEKSSILQRKLEELLLEIVRLKIVKKQLERTKVELELVKVREELAKLNNITSLNITSSPIPQEFNLTKVVNVETSNNYSLSIHKKISTCV